MRVLVVSSIVLQLGQQLGGINAVFYYSTGFFEGVIQDARSGSALVAFVNVVATYVALKIMDKTARRTLILLSSGGMLLSIMLIIPAMYGLTSDLVAVGAVMSYVSFFEIGMGPIPWLIVAEMFDAKVLCDTTDPDGVCYIIFVT
jgi:SP family facilitated glucose transporter-like MFS transporter 3